MSPPCRTDSNETDIKSISCLGVESIKVHTDEQILGNIDMNLSLVENNNIL
jgi:hypothetical protein